MDSIPSCEPGAALTLPARLGTAPAAVVAPDYHPALSTSALIAEVRRQLGSERRAGRLVCRYLADLADRICDRRDRELVGVADEFHAAACFFDLGARETRERVRIGRALRGLPRVEAAFVAGDLSYSKVREVTRVARGETESAWLDLARSLDMRALERHVARSRAEPRRARARAAHDSDVVCSDELHSDDLGSKNGLGSGARESDAAELLADTPGLSECAAPASRGFDTGAASAPLVPTAHRAPAKEGATRRQLMQPRCSPAPARTGHTECPSVRVTFELSTGAWALLERALEGARRRATAHLSDAEALEVVAREALDARSAAGKSSFDDADASDNRPVDTDADPAPLLERPPVPSSSAPGQAAPVKLATLDSALSSRGGRGSQAADVARSGDVAIGETTPHIGSTMAPTARLLGIIGRRRGWCLDQLGHESGMSVPELQHALLLLELSGHIRRMNGWVDPAS